eukprot:SAG11_NODE_24304_length_375_cov_0.931159_1_plen_58_part_10
MPTKLLICCSQSAPGEDGRSGVDFGRSGVDFDKRHDVKTKTVEVNMDAVPWDLYRDKK